MGKRSNLVAFLCGFFGRKRTPNADDDPLYEDTLDPSSIGSGDAKHANTPADPTRDSNAEATANDEEQPVLPPPPGRLHSRTSSYHHHHDRSHSMVSKLASSMSMKLPGNVNGMVGRQLNRLEEKAAGIRDKTKLKHEDSIWKKQIILGERNKIPDEDEDSFVYDEKGNRISPYHQKSHSSAALSFSRPDFNSQELSKK